MDVRSQNCWTAEKFSGYDGAFGLDRPAVTKFGRSQTNVARLPQNSQEEPKMQSLKRMITRALLVPVFGAVALANATAAATPEGTWKFERSMDYFGRTPLNQAPKFPALTVSTKEIRLSVTCVAQFSAERYAFPSVFQPLSKQGVTAKQLDSFLVKNFGLALGKVQAVYSLDSSPGNCADPVMEFFYVDDRILIADGVTFYSYRKAGAPAVAPTGLQVAGPYAAYKVTPLPMNYDRYYESCRPKILGGKRLPKTTDKCAPDYFPYVADPKSNDALMKLIGNHDYEKDGSEYAAGFSPPFEQKTAATFLVFPPMKQVTLVRVDDFEVVRNEQRDIMSGVYLSIVGGKVIDQIWGCQFNSAYVCTAAGRPVAKLTESGKFQAL
jgi:hypothetical protein